MIDYVGKHRYESSQDLVKGLIRSAKKHEGNTGQLDDITAVIVKAM
jgi:serine phosphatase RsbU (regulator of sigma subunit)